MLDKMSDASRLIDRLQAKGLVDRLPSTEDRRKAGVVISERGLDLLREIDDLEADTLSLFSGISEAEARQTNAALDALRGI